MLSTGDRVLQKKNMPSTSWSLGAAQPNVFEQAITRPVGWVSPNGKCGDYQPMAKALDGDSEKPWMMSYLSRDQANE